MDAAYRAVVSFSGGPLQLVPFFAVVLETRVVPRQHELTRVANPLEVASISGRTFVELSYLQAIPRAPQCRVSIDGIVRVRRSGDRVVVSDDVRARQEVTSIEIEPSQGPSVDMALVNLYPEGRSGQGGHRLSDTVARLWPCKTVARTGAG